jgi:uncharacterized membrane protein YkoI
MLTLARWPEVRPPATFHPGGLTVRTLQFALALLAGLFWAGAGRSDEEKVDLDKLPAKVKGAVQKEFKDAEFVSASKEKEDGKLLYEVRIKVKGQTVEVTTTEDGEVVEVEKEIAVKDLPKAVAGAISEKYPKAVVKKAEEVTKGGKTAYEVLLDTADKKTLEIKYDKDGKVLETEEKTGKDDDEKKKDKKDK